MCCRPPRWRFGKRLSLHEFPGARGMNAATLVLARRPLGAGGPGASGSSFHGHLDSAGGVHDHVG